MKKIIVAIAALAMLTGSAYAAEWNFYGSARVATFYTDTETINSAVVDVKGISETLQSNARIGANVKVSDELIGRFEYGTYEAAANIRLLYGEWNFGAGKFLVGQDYVPLYLPGSNQVYATDNGLGGWGEVYGGRKAQLKLTFGGFQVAAVAPNTDMADNTGAAANASTTEVVLPQIQVQYAMSGDNWTVRAAAAYQTFEYKPNTTSDDVNSYYLGIDGKIAMGAFTLVGQIHGGQNGANLTGINVTNVHALDGYAKENTAQTGVVDNDAFGFRVALGYTVNDMFGLELGYGHMETEYDEAGSSEDEVNAWYFQVPITMAPGVFVIPEVGVTDYDETDQTEVTYFGAKWQINF